MNIFSTPTHPIQQNPINPAESDALACGKLLTVSWPSDSEFSNACFRQLCETYLHIQLQNVHLRLHECAEVGLSAAEVSVNKLLYVAVQAVIKGTLNYLHLMCYNSKSRLEYF